MLPIKHALRTKWDQSCVSYQRVRLIFDRKFKRTTIKGGSYGRAGNKPTERQNY